ncbi:MAG: hypothetical protein IKN17_10775 [Ruminococcus sp.]|nr:hypothetical protein [Ruminococcus sp.]
MKKRIISLAAAVMMMLSAAVQAAAWDFDETELPALASQGYGYQDMTKRSNPEARQALYDRIYIAMYNFWFNTEDCEKIIQGRRYFEEVPFNDLGLNGTEAMEVYFTFRNDNPLFYFISFNCLASSTTLYLKLDEEFVKGETRQNYQAEILNYVSEKMDMVEDVSKPYDVTLAFHDAIVNEAEYARSEDGTVDDSLIAHSILGIIDRQSGVCESYSRLFQLLLNLKGVENVFVSGTGNGGDHAWNMVKLDDGNYYCYDVTWDDTARTRDFIARGTNFFDRLHTPDSSEGVGLGFLYELPEVPEEDYKPPMPGDTDGNDRVNMRDYALLQRYLLDNSIEINMVNSDLNDDGKVNMRDYALLQKMLLTAS